MEHTSKANLLMSLRMDDELNVSSLSDGDQKIIAEILREINIQLNTSFSTFAELASLRIHGCGEIVAKHIFQLSSEHAKMELLHHLVSDKIPYCGKILLQLYEHYIQERVTLSTEPCREEFYDDAFSRLRAKHMANELFTLISNPVNAFALPLTLKMLASWRYPGLQERLLVYLDFDCSPEADNLRNCHNYRFICRELRFSALSCLRYFPSHEVIELLMKYASNADPDVHACAERSLFFSLKKISQ